uniref:Uncharacterized protein n=1 Tax=Escherichia coli TaxID=562 RepID=A0A7U1HRK9_ECOLX|nr:hypothetical protein [Escherichia coli]
MSHVWGVSAWRNRAETVPLMHRDLKGTGASSLTLLQTSHSFMTR